MSAWNAGKGCAPVSLRPFTKNDGVPLAPTAWTTFWSRSIRALWRADPSASFIFAASRPASFAAWRMAGSSSVAAPKSASCIAQNFASPPCARASSVAIAAGSARAWNGSGLCLKTKRTLPRYASSTCFSVGPTRLQKGHSKSEDSTIVTRASAGPFTGESSTGTRYTARGSSVGRVGRGAWTAAVGGGRAPGRFDVAPFAIQPTANPTTSASNQLTCFMARILL